jgi:hypothetical protein
MLMMGVIAKALGLGAKPAAEPRPPVEHDHKCEREFFDRHKAGKCRLTVALAPFGPAGIRPGDTARLTCGPYSWAILPIEAVEDRGEVVAIVHLGSPIAFSDPRKPECS